jgi:hypothetical protein
MHERYPHRELVPFAEWDDLAACWDKDLPGKVVVVEIAHPEDPGYIEDGFWPWFLSAVISTVHGNPDLIEWQ